MDETAETIGMAMGTLGWAIGVVVLVTMAALPLLERWGSQGWGRR